MKAKKYLEQLKKYDALIANKLEEKLQWRMVAGGITTPQICERVQSSGNKQKMESAICDYIDMETEIDECIDRYVDAKKEILETIEQLETIEYNILHKMYVGMQKGTQRVYLTLDDVAELYGKTYSWAATMHGNALKSVQNIIDER